MQMDEVCQNLNLAMKAMFSIRKQEKQLQPCSDVSVYRINCIGVKQI